MIIRNDLRRRLRDLELTCCDYGATFTWTGRRAGLFPKQAALPA